MGEIYLIRHGQAGLRNDYDRLSELGHFQASRLGKYFRDRDIQFDRVVSGGLRRQRETAAAIVAGAEVDEQWNEFDLDAVYSEIAPQLTLVDDVFRLEYEALTAAAQDPENPVHRSWRPSDYAVVKAWVEARFQVKTETWIGFQERIHKSFADFSGEGRMALVSSATPIGIVTAKLLESPEWKALELAGSLLNASFTVLRSVNGTWRLAGFNHTPHLEEEKHRTHR